MSDNQSNEVLKGILEKIELPNSAYERAEKRYKDIGDWLHRPESSCVEYDPNVFSQGSFRLGTGQILMTNMTLIWGAICNKV